jgi:hypothetical protein
MGNPSSAYKFGAKLKTVPNKDVMSRFNASELATFVAA